MRRVRFGILDVGSNTEHLLVADAVGPHLALGPAEGIVLTPQEWVAAV